jgi:heavy metal sensor kinase
MRHIPDAVESASGSNPAGRRAVRQQSFRRRLAVQMTLLCVSILAISLLAVFIAIQQALWRNYDQMLASIARSEIASSMDGPGGHVHTHDVTSIPLKLRVGDGYEKFLQIMDGDGRIVAHTRNITAESALNIDANSAAIARTEGSALGNVWRGEERFRGLYYRLRDADGNQFLAVLAIPREPVLHLLRLLALALSATLLLAGTAAAVASFKLSEYLTRPLARIAAAASLVHEGDLSTRIPEVSNDYELRNVTLGLNEMLERLEEAFGTQTRTLESQQRFTADASHELRTPLTNLQGHLEVALRNPRSAEEYRQTLEIALSETKRMARLVRDLLTLSRADANLLQLRLNNSNLSEIAADSARAFEQRFETANIELIVEGPREVMVACDRDRLRQVIENLLDNALRYAPRGSTVRILLAANSSEASIEVVDEGPGLTEAEQGRVFERFYRTDPSRAADTGGTGLGLSIARAIVEAHGGTIGVSSEPGKTTSFTVRLKRDTLQTAPATPPLPT